jgi:ribonuclease D
MAIVTRIDELNEICREIDQLGRLAIDLEFIPERTYAPILCLVQVATDRNSYLIDPLAISDLDILWQRVCDPTILVVLHAANQDLDIINALSSRVPKNVVDTQIFAGFAGLGYPLGYGKLLNQLLNITIDKTESFTDWLTRPLTDAQITYATEDVCHLLPMYDCLKTKLTELGRLTWALEECNRYVDAARYEKDHSQDFLRIKGSSSLSRRGLAVLSALCDWRTSQAKRSNRPIRSVLSDNTLIELCRRPPRQLSEIQRVRSIRADQVRSFGDQVLQAVEKGMAIPEAQLPTWPLSRTPARRDVLIADMLFAILKVLTYEADLAAELLGTRDDVQAFVKIFGDGAQDKATLPLFHGWRWEMAGKHLSAALNGRPVTVTLNKRGDPPVDLGFS